jgi:prepilin-type N-terminal cleavage/methylation domain-containing protein
MRRLAASRPECGSRGRTSGPQTESGLTLIELLIAIVLLGVAGTSVLALWSEAINASGRHRDIADAQAVLSAAAERIAARAPWPNCAAASTTDYQTVARTASLPAKGGWTAGDIMVDKVEYWTGRGSDSGTIFDASPSACSDFFKMRRVTLTVTSPKGKLEHLEVVTSDV